MKKLSLAIALMAGSVFAAEAPVAQPAAPSVAAQPSAAAQKLEQQLHAFVDQNNAIFAQSGQALRLRILHFTPSTSGAETVIALENAHFLAPLWLQGQLPSEKFTLKMRGVLFQDAPLAARGIETRMIFTPILDETEKRLFNPVVRTIFNHLSVTYDYLPQNLNAELRIQPFTINWEGSRITFKGFYQNILLPRKIEPLSPFVLAGHFQGLSLKKEFKRSVKNQHTISVKTLEVLPSDFSEVSKVSAGQGSLTFKSAPALRLKSRMDGQGFDFAIGEVAIAGKDIRYVPELKDATGAFHIVLKNLEARIFDKSATAPNVFLVPAVTLDTYTGLKNQHLGEKVSLNIDLGAQLPALFAKNMGFEPHTLNFEMGLSPLDLNTVNAFRAFAKRVHDEDGSAAELQQNLVELLEKLAQDQTQLSLGAQVQFKSGTPKIQASLRLVDNPQVLQEMVKISQTNAPENIFTILDRASHYRYQITLPQRFVEAHRKDLPPQLSLLFRQDPKKKDYVFVGQNSDGKEAAKTVAAPKAQTPAPAAPATPATPATPAAPAAAQ